MGKGKPDQTEVWAREFLEHSGFAPNDIVFEPDGNVPPDFLVENRIAIEVRRLNQYWRDPSGSWTPLEALEYPLIERFNKVLEEFGAPTHAVSWYVFPTFERPLDKGWHRNLASALVPFQRGEVEEKDTEIRLGGHLQIQMMRRAKPAEDTFIFGGSSDLNSGGWVGEQLSRSLEVAIEEKTAKIADRRSKYSEWWLVLVDHMMGGMPAEAGSVLVHHNWNQVIVIHPGNYSGAYRILSSPGRTIA